MAAISVTVKDVSPLPGAIIRSFDAGGTIEPGDPVYMASDGDVERADSDAEASAEAIGVCVAVGTEGAVSANEGDRVDVVLYGPVTGYSGMTPGDEIYVGDTAGTMEDAAAATGEYLWAVGRALSASVLMVNPGPDATAAQQ